MLEKLQQVLNSDSLEGITDSGYHYSSHIKTCEDRRIDIHIASKTAISKASNQGRFADRDFICDKENDVYHCSQGNQLKPREKPQIIARKVFHGYRSGARVCHECWFELKLQRSVLVEHPSLFSLPDDTLLSRYHSQIILKIICYFLKTATIIYIRIKIIYARITSVSFYAIKIIIKPLVYCNISLWDR